MKKLSILKKQEIKAGFPIISVVLVITAAILGFIAARIDKD